MSALFHEIVVHSENVPAKIVIHTPGQPDIVPHWHESLELICSMNSRLYVQNGNSHLQVKENDIVIINSCLPHTVIPLKDYRYSGISITFDMDFFRKFCPNTEYAYFDFKKNIEKKKEILCCMKEIYQLHIDVPENPYFHLKVSSLLYYITYILMKDLMMSPSSPPRLSSSKYQHRYKQIMEFVHLHYAEPLKLEDVANFSGLSKEYLSREFKSYVGEGFRDYLNNIRVSKAQYELINTDIPLTSLALKHGFPDLRSYNRSFIKYYKISPFQYRREHKQT